MLLPSHHSLLSLALIFSAGIRTVYCSVVTLYYVSPPPPSSFTPVSASFEDIGTTIASAIGPGNAGMTRYEIQQIRSKLVAHESDTTFTVIDSPLTITYTLEQGATSVYASAPPFITQESESGGWIIYEGIKQNCSLDLSQHSGDCVEVDEDPDLVFASGSESSSTTIATSTRTFSGPLIPLATFVTSDARPNSQFMKAPVILLLGAILAMIAI